LLGLAIALKGSIYRAGTLMRFLSYCPWRPPDAARGGDYGSKLGRPSAVINTQAKVFGAMPK
jgi:hypothetical protein